MGRYKHKKTKQEVCEMKHTPATEKRGFATVSETSKGQSVFYGGFGWHDMPPKIFGVVFGWHICHPRFSSFFFECCMTCDPTTESTWLAELLELPATTQQTSSPSQLPSRAVQPPPPSQAKVNRAKVAYRAPAALLLSL